MRIVRFWRQIGNCWQWLLGRAFLLVASLGCEFFASRERDNT